MSWYAFDPSDIDEDPGFVRLSPNALALATLMTCRSLRRGPLAPDIAIYRALWGDRFIGQNFASIYAEVLTCFEVNQDGLLHIPWIDSAREDTLKRLESCKLRNRSYRQSKRENAVRDASRDAVRDAPTGQDKTGQDKKPLTPLGKAPAEPVVWPKELQTPTFQATWTEYEQHRRENRQKPYKPTGLKRLIGEMMEVGHDLAVAGLKKTMACNWQGPHFDKPKTNGYAPANRVGSADYLPEIDR